MRLLSEDKAHLSTKLAESMYVQIQAYILATKFSVVLLRQRNLIYNHYSPKDEERGILISRDSVHVVPEYAIHGQLSKKVDTYIFGIVVLEVISGEEVQGCQRWRCSYPMPL